MSGADFTPLRGTSPKHGPVREWAQANGYPASERGRLGTADHFRTEGPEIIAVRRVGDMIVGLP
ncbi:Lsr2 family DNA-binding protein [Nonomuraea composti]|uniref:Lsr2 family DNA-binding protein n=1 Tax=Nonomuraea composti TaxID=2720023 RepID=UPI003D165F24